MVFGEKFDPDEEDEEDLASFTQDPTGEDQDVSVFSSCDLPILDLPVEESCETHEIVLDEDVAPEKPRSWDADLSDHWADDFGWIEAGQGGMGRGIGGERVGDHRQHWTENNEFFPEEDLEVLFEDVAPML